jgi:hypothetical protein
MTLLLNLFRFGWIYLALAAIVALQMYWRLSGHPARIFYLVFLGFCMASLLGWLYLRHKKIVSGYALPIYIALALNPLFFYLGYLFSDTAIALILPFFPIIILHYFLKVHKKYIPGSGAFFIMLIGFVISVAYQLIVSHGKYPYMMTNDLSFFINIVFFIVFYAFLSLGVLSIRHVVIILSFSVLPFLVLIVYQYFREGMLDLMMTERFGSSMGYSANFISVCLDLALPPMVFIALNEKKLSLKLFFSFVAGFYCLIIILTSSRGSIPGLIILLIYCLARSRSIRTWILILVLSAGAIGLFSGPVIKRIFKPDKADIYSNLGRIELVKSAYPFLKQNYFIFGIGLDNFRFEKFKYGFPAWFDKDKAMSSHDVFLEFWTAWGLFGFLGWLYFIFGSLLHLIRTKLPQDIHYLKISLIFAAISFSLHGFSDSAIAFSFFCTYLFSWFACISFLIHIGSMKPGSFRVSNSNIVICNEPYNNKERISNA